MGSRQLIIHIGTEKTGTTTLQNFLHHNAKVLAEHGVWYPAEPGSTYTERRAHFPMAGSLVSSSVDFVSQAKERTIARCLDDFCADAMAGSHAICIISAEHFSSRVRDAERLRQFRDRLSACFEEIKVACYVRNQADMALSSYSTDVVHGARHSFDPASISADDPYLNHLSMLQLWDSVFGRSALIVREYDRNRLLQGDICRDFSQEILRIDPGRLAYVADTNASLGAVFLELLRQINQSLPTLKENAAGWRAAQGIRATLIANLRIENDFPLKLGTSERQRLLDRFSDINKQLNERYFANSLSKTWFDAREGSYGDQGTDMGLVTRMTMSALGSLVIQLLSGSNRH